MVFFIQLVLQFVLCIALFKVCGYCCQDNFDTFWQVHASVDQQHGLLWTRLMSLRTLSAKFFFKKLGSIAKKKYCQTKDGYTEVKVLSFWDPCARAHQTCKCSFLLLLFSCSGGLKLLITVSFLVVFTETFSNFAIKLDKGIDYCFNSFLWNKIW